MGEVQLRHNTCTVKYSHGRVYETAIVLCVLTSLMIRLVSHGGGKEGIKALLSQDVSLL